MTPQELAIIRADIEALRCDLRTSLANAEAKLGAVPSMRALKLVAISASVAVLAFTAALAVLARSIGLV